MKTYTVWVGYDTGRGTTYVTSVEAASADEAMGAALTECAAAWDLASDDDSLLVRGVAEGAISLIYWNDLDE